MNISCILVACLCLALEISHSGCAKRESLINDAEIKGKEDLDTFIFRNIAEYSGRSFVEKKRGKTRDIDYVYWKDKDGVQVACVGNKIEIVCSMLRRQLGQPDMVKTNAKGLSAFVYGLKGAGLIINCGLESSSAHGTNQEITHLVIAKSTVR